MSKIKFMTDSASDISTADEKDLDIEILPFSVTFGDKTYLSRVEIDNEHFYEMLEAAPTIPTTSQITVYRYTEEFEKVYAQGYDTLINVTINSEGSGTYNSACLAAQMFYETNPDAEGRFTIYNIDGAGYTCGYGYAVVKGATLYRQGKGVEEILAAMHDWIDHNVIYFAMHSLKFAAKSGRIPSAAAFVGELVGLKPIMRLYDHAILTNDKVRGEKKMVVTIKNKAVAEIAPGAEYIVIYGSHEEDADAMESAMTEALGYPPVRRCQIGAAVATNAGPRLVGISFHEK